MVMRFDVEFFGGAIVGLIIGLAIGLSIGQARADCTGCAPGKGYEHLFPNGTSRPWANRVIGPDSLVAPTFVTVPKCYDGYEPVMRMDRTIACARDLKEPQR